MEAATLMSAFETLKTVGTVISAISAFSQADSEGDAYDYNAGVAQQNAVSARQQGEAQSADQQRKVAMRMGQMRAAYGKSGVQTEGSALDVIESSAAIGELDKQTLRYNAELRALGYENTANLDRMRADNARSAGMGKATSSLMGSLTGLVGSGSSDFISSGDTSGTMFSLNSGSGLGLNPSRSGYGLGYGMLRTG